MSTYRKLAGVICLGAALIIALAPRLPTLHATSATPASFVTRCGIHFCLDSNIFYVAGANTYDVFTFGDGASTATPSDIETKFMDKARIDAHFANLAADNVSVLRLWMFSHETWHGFEPQRGVYSSAQFMLFDYIIQSAKAHNIRLIPVFENFWEAYGGIQTRLQWEGLGGDFANRWKFFNKTACSGCFTHYKNYVAYALNHRNHYTNIAYKDEPTIMGWELMNEPRYQNATPNENSTGTTLRAWVDEMGAYIKNIDPNHLLGTGLEGHAARYGFGGDEGNPFVTIHQSPWIDFTSAHPYPTESWANLSLDQTRALIRAWIYDSHAVIGKPFFMGEFNTHQGSGDRAQWWSAIFGELEANDGDGSAFWAYMEHNDSGAFTIMHSASELAVFRQHAFNMRAKNRPSDPTTTPNPTTTDTASLPTAPPNPTAASTPIPTLETPPSTVAVVDDLNDWSKAFAHSLNLAFDRGNTQYFGGDLSHLNRTSNTNEWVVWQLVNLHRFRAIGYHWPYESLAYFRFYTSSDNAAYTPITPAITNGGGDWTRIDYSFVAPSGTQYVKIEFPTAGQNAWTPQIGQVVFDAPNTPTSSPAPTTAPVVAATTTAPAAATMPAAQPARLLLPLIVR